MGGNLGLCGKEMLDKEIISLWFVSLQYGKVNYLLPAGLFSADRKNYITLGNPIRDNSPV
jgi:hypothetical protein